MRKCSVIMDFLLCPLNVPSVMPSGLFALGFLLHSSNKCVSFLLCDSQQVLLFYGRFNKLTKIQWLKTTQIHSLQVLWVRSLKPVPRGWSPSVSRAVFLWRLLGDNLLSCLFFWFWRLPASLASWILSYIISRAFFHYVTSITVFASLYKEPENLCDYSGLSDNLRSSIYLKTINLITM